MRAAGPDTCLMSRVKNRMSIDGNELSISWDKMSNVEASSYI